MEVEVKIIKGGVREYRTKSIIQRLRNIIMSNKVAGSPKNLFIEKSVEFLRHPENIHLSDNIIIKEGAKLCPTNSDSVIKIGENTTIGYYSMLFSSFRIEIGADCMISPFAYLVDANHGIIKDKLINQQKLEAKPIRIHDDVWVGTGVKILAGAEIGRGAVISANAVVSGEIPENAIVVGNPGRVMSYRTEK
jgi:acetyltransferase-like isoleucine patch superfamily enzyme